MLYIRKFYVVQKIYIFISISIHRWDTGTQLQWQVTNMACNDLRARGAWGRDAPPSPPPQQLYIYIYKNKLSVCLSSDFRCVDWRHCKDWAVCVMKLFVDWRHVCQLMKLQTGTQMTTGTRGYREYKWRPGTSKRNYRLGHRDTGNINDDRDTVTQLQRGRRGYREDI